MHCSHLYTITLERVMHDFYGVITCSAFVYGHLQAKRNVMVDHVDR